MTKKPMATSASISSVAAAAVGQVEIAVTSAQVVADNPINDDVVFVDPPSEPPLPPPPIDPPFEVKALGDIGTYEVFVPEEIGPRDATPDPRAIRPEPDFNIPPHPTPSELVEDEE